MLTPTWIFIYFHLHYKEWRKIVCVCVIPPLLFFYSHIFIYILIYSFRMPFYSTAATWFGKVRDCHSRDLDKEKAPLLSKSEKVIDAPTMYRN